MKKHVGVLVPVMPRVRARRTASPTKGSSSAMNTGMLKGYRIHRNSPLPHCVSFESGSLVSLRRMKNRTLALIGILLATQLVACTVAVRAPLPVAEVVVARPPPPPRPEPPPPPPPGDPVVYIWQPGHWVWEHNEYVWRVGHYERRPRREAHWVPAEWVERGGQWVFHPGHWQ